MAGENRTAVKERLELDPVVDLALTGLGVLILTLLALQTFLTVERYLPMVHVSVLTLVSSLGVLIAMIGRKARRGLHDLPKMVRFFEVAVLAGLTLGLGLLSGYPILAIVLTEVVVLIIYGLAYELANASEELLFDFTNLTEKANWQKQWETEGYRLYDRHIVGLRHLQNLILSIDILLVLDWLIIQKIGWGTVFCGVLIFCLQMIFLGVGFYQKKRIFWAIHSYEVDQRVLTRMVGLVVGLALLFSTVAAVLPVNYNPVPWKAIGNLINALFSEGIPRAEMVFPTPKDSTEEKEMPEQTMNPQMIAGPAWQIWLFFALIGCLILFLVVMILGYLISQLGEERYRLQGLSGLLSRIYLFFREMFSAWIRGLCHGLTAVRLNLEHRREEKAKLKLHKLLEDNAQTQRKDWLPENPREEVVMLFLEVLHLFRERGIHRGANQTLSEYAAVAVGEIPVVAEEIWSIQRLVELALYSVYPLTQDEARTMEVQVRQVREKLTSISEK